MRSLRRNAHWLLTIVATAILTGAAVTVAQRETASDVPVATNAHNLSSVFRAISKQVLPSVVSIETTQKTTQSRPSIPENSPFRDFFKNNPELREFFDGRQRQQVPRTGMGSGFVIDKSGIIMTNNHVVAGADRVVVSMHDGREFVAKEVKTDPVTDIAIIRIEPPKDLQAISLGDSDAMQIGDWVLAVGSPFELEFSVTAGIVSAKQRGRGIAARESFIQTDAAINPGNSGGPLLNLNGEVIGINTAIASRSGGSDGIGFAIPVNMAKWVSRQLIDNGEVRRAYLGVAIQPVNNALARKFKIQVGEGAIINLLGEGGPAAKSGLKLGDIILDFNGKPVSGPSSLQGIVERLIPDKTYPMTILREGKKQNIDVTVREMPEEYFAKGAGNQRRRPQERTPEAENFNEIGIEVSNLTAGIAQKLGYDEGVKGVVITSVDPNSIAGQAGLRAGVVIQKVDNKTVTSVDQFDAALKNASLEEGILFLVRTLRGTQFVVIEQK